jgi:DNA-binding MarR family transcriptional regulator
MNARSTIAGETPRAHLSEDGLQGIVGYQLAQARLTTNEVFERCVGKPHGLSPVEFTILGLVGRNPGVSARQLARALAVKPPKLTIWLDRLEQRGLVSRVRSSEDRRRQEVTLTRLGRSRQTEAMAAVRAGETQALASLTGGERALLVELLHKVAAAGPRWRG